MEMFEGEKEYWLERSKPVQDIYDKELEKLVLLQKLTESKRRLYSIFDESSINVQILKQKELDYFKKSNDLEYYEDFSVFVTLLTASNEEMKYVRNKSIENIKGLIDLKENKLRFLKDDINKLYSKAEELYEKYNMLSNEEIIKYINGGPIHEKLKELTKEKEELLRLKSETMFDINKLNAAYESKDLAYITRYRKLMESLMYDISKNKREEFMNQIEEIKNATMLPIDGNIIVLHVMYKKAQEESKLIKSEIVNNNYTRKLVR